MDISELDYQLPPHLVATHPAQPRDAARLLVINRARGTLSHHHVRDLPDLPENLGPRAGDVMIFNQTRVLPAQFDGVRAATGGRIGGLFVESPSENLWRVMLESRGTLREGETVTLDDHAHLTLTQKLGSGHWLAELKSNDPTLTVLTRIGRPPLPPYILKARRALGEVQHRADDETRYNTIFAQQPGSVAAPTASLHFTPELVARLQQRGVKIAYITLHVGLGTFAPIRVQNLREHPMHSEQFSVPRDTLAAIAHAKAQGNRVIPVGTTCVRALESLPDPLPEDDYHGETTLFVRPPEEGEDAFVFRFTDVMMTNFHLPRSTLLALVAALPNVGIEQLRSWYEQAAAQQYRFYSFGDAMWLA